MGKALAVQWWKCTPILNPWNSIKAICTLHVCNPRTPTRQRQENHQRLSGKLTWHMTYVTEKKAWKVERGETQKGREECN